MQDEITVSPLVDILSKQLGEPVVMNGEDYVYHAGLLPVSQNDVDVALLEQGRDFEKKSIERFTKITTEFIQERINQFNLDNGTKFDNVHNCESFSRTAGYTHQVWCGQVWTWSVAVWEAVRGLTTIPTDTEFQAVLDGVAF